MVRRHRNLRAGVAHDRTKTQQQITYVILRVEEGESLMQEKITITLPQNVRTALEVVLAEEGKSANDLISQAIAEYLFFRELRLLQEKLTAKAQRRGIFSEEDVFEQVS